MSIIHKSADELSAIIKRLQAEKVEDESNAREAGEADGYEAAADMTFSELVYATGKFLDGDASSAFFNDVFKDAVLSEVFTSRLELADDEHDEFRTSIFEDADDDGRLGASARAYMSGWLQGVRELWDEVKDAI